MSPFTDEAHRPSIIDFFGVLRHTHGQGKSTYYGIAILHPQLGANRPISAQISLWVSWLIQRTHEDTSRTMLSKTARFCEFLSPFGAQIWTRTYLGTALPRRKGRESFHINLPSCRCRVGRERKGAISGGYS